MYIYIYIYIYYIIYILGPSRQQKICYSSFTIKIGLIAKAETAVQHSTQQLVKTLVGCYLNK